MDLIDREALKKELDEYNEFAVFDCEAVRDIIDNAPTVEITETEIQAVLNKRCMTAVANEYLIALHGIRPHGKTNAEIFKQIFGIYATELWTMTNADFMEWLNGEYER